VLFVKEEGHCKVADLLLRVFVRRNKIDRFEMSKVDIPTEDVYIEKLMIVRAMPLGYFKGN
jgi:hypothetical protein